MKGGGIEGLGGMLKGVEIEEMSFIFIFFFYFFFFFFLYDEFVRVLLENLF